MGQKGASFFGMKTLTFSSLVIHTAITRTLTLSENTNQKHAESLRLSVVYGTAREKMIYVLDTKQLRLR